MNLRIPYFRLEHPKDKCFFNEYVWISSRVDRNNIYLFNGVLRIGPALVTMTQDVDISTWGTIGCIVGGTLLVGWLIYNDYFGFFSNNQQPVGPVDAQLPAAHVPIEELPAAHVPIEELPAAHVPIEELPAADLPAAHLSIEDLPIEDLPIEELLVDALQIDKLIESTIIPLLSSTGGVTSIVIMSLAGVIGPSLQGIIANTITSSVSGSGSGSVSGSGSGSSSTNYNTILLARDLEPGLSQEDEDFIVEIDSIAHMESQNLEEVTIFENQFDSQLLADLMNIETYMRSLEAIRNTPHFSVILDELEKILDTLWAIIGYLKSLSKILEIPAYIDDILSTNIRSYVSRMRARIEASIVENDALDIERTRLYKAKEKELARARARSRNLGRLLIDAIGRSLRDYRNRSALNRVRYIVDLFNRNQAEVRTLQSELDNLSEARGRVAQAKAKLSWAKDRINNRSYNWGNFLKVKKLGETVIVNLERYKRGLTGSNRVVTRLRLGISGADTGSGLVIIELANKADLLKFEALKIKLAKSRQKAVLIEKKRLEYFNKWNGYVRKMKSCILDFGHQYRTQSNAFMDDWNRVKKYMKF